MLFEKLLDLLKNFGFQMEECDGVEACVQNIGCDKSLCIIHESEIKWYQPKDKSETYLKLYNQNPFFLSMPEEQKSSHSDLKLYNFNQALTSYEQVLHIVYFLQSGCVDAFYVNNKYYIYPDVILKKYSITSPKTQSKDVANEIKSFIDALKLNPDSAVLHNYIGKLYIENNDIENASKYFVNACEKEPQYAEPFSNMGALMWNAGEKEKGFKLFCEAFLRNPFDSTLQDNFIKAGIDLNAPDIMSQAITKTQEYYPEYKGMLYVKALLLESLGNKEESKKIISEYLKFYPDDQRAQQFLTDTSPIKV